MPAPSRGLVAFFCGAGPGNFPALSSRSRYLQNTNFENRQKLRLLPPVARSTGGGGRRLPQSSCPVLPAQSSKAHPSLRPPPWHEISVLLRQQTRDPFAARLSLRRRPPHRRLLTVRRRRPPSPSEARQPTPPYSPFIGPWAACNRSPIFWCATMVAASCLASP